VVRYLKVASAALVLAGCLFMANNRALAISGVTPDVNDRLIDQVSGIPKTSNKERYLVVANGDLNAPHAWAYIYVPVTNPASTFNITIEDAAHTYTGSISGNHTFRSGAIKLDGGKAWPTYFQIGGGQVLSNDNDIDKKSIGDGLANNSGIPGLPKDTLNCGTSICFKNVSSAGYDKVTTAGGTTYYEIPFHAWTFASGFFENGFRVIATDPGVELGYAGNLYGSGQFAIANTDGIANNETISVGLEFGIPCGTTSYSPIRAFDDDYTAPFQTTAIKWAIFARDRAAADGAAYNIFIDGGDLTAGNDGNTNIWDWANLSYFTGKRREDFDYYVRFDNIWRQNGVQFSLPYKQIDAFTPACTPPNSPPSLSWSMGCVANGATARAFYTISVSDPDGDPVSLAAGWPHNFNGVPITSFSGSINVGYTTGGNGVAWITDGRGGFNGSFGPGYACPAPPTPAVTCTGISPVSQNEPGEPFDPKFLIRNSDVTNTISINTTSVISSSLGNASSPVMGVGPNASWVYGTGTGVNTIVGSPLSFTVPGDNPVSSTVTWSDAYGRGGTIPCSPLNMKIVTKPYFRVLSGDIVSTGGGPIKGWNKNGSTPAYADPGFRDSSGKSGAGAQGLIIGSNVVNGVSSGVLLTSYTGPKDITFANNNPFIVYGGGFGSTGYSLPPDTSTQPYTGNNNGVFYSATGMSYSNPAIGNKLRMTVFVQTGDLNITGNISYSNTPGSVSDIPHIKFVVLNGNINIAPGVNQIDAELVASGTINTCSVSPLTYDACKGYLIVNGSLTAGKISLNRTSGTLRESKNTDGSSGSCAPGGGPNTNYGSIKQCNGSNIAEIIQFNPELYLAPPADSTSGTAGAGYDAITALPPIF
jgi:hypothetical protein